MTERETLAAVLRHAFCCSSICQAFTELVETEALVCVSTDLLRQAQVLAERLVQPCAVGAALYVRDFGPLASQYSRSINVAPPTRLLRDLISEHEQLVRSITEWATRIPPDRQRNTLSKAYGSQADPIARALEELQRVASTDLTDSDGQIAA